MKHGSKWILTNQKINKDEVQYEWVAESTACEVCQGLNGKIYDSANDIPDRPHPNCKCHIEIIEKEPDEPVTDPITIYRKERFEKQRVMLEIKKAQGDIKSLLEEIDEYINQVEKEDEKLEQFKNKITEINLDIEDKQKLISATEKLEFAKYRGEKLKKTAE